MSSHRHMPPWARGEHFCASARRTAGLRACLESPPPHSSPACWQAFNEEDSDALVREWHKIDHLRPVPPPTPDGFLQVRRSGVGTLSTATASHVPAPSAHERVRRSRVRRDTRSC